MKHLATCAALAGMMTASSAFAGGTIKFGHDNKADPFENPAHACTAVFSNILEAGTNGSVDVEVFGSNQLGTAAEHVQQVRDGILQATLTSTGALASYYPRIDVLNLPFAFADNSSTYEVFDGAFGTALAADIEETLGDVVVLGFPDTGGFFAVTNSKRPIADLADFEGVRVRTMTLPSHQKIMQALGAEAYPLAWGEVYSGLQTGVIDGQMNPVPIISFANFAEVQEYMTLTNHLFSPYTFMINRAFYEDLTDQERTVLHHAAENCVTASRGISRIIEASDRGLAGLMDQIEVTALTAEQRKAMADATQPVFETHVAENLDAKAGELLELLKTEVSAANGNTYLD
ncbi:MAG: DctP family TRAP transporter solute-binding subunit [Marinovum algicola]|jgi:tripartite ATP-independent transporter DctP family solute receptor|uniref:Tripartite ATP-independent transporter solute receptor, DctP family n=2 Tax=Marinovum algicola TaxID=42444 RepID=A0A975WA35_9RHOB|nr:MULTISPECIES: DctP family TRAP transporter solute-binding subunit [Marinovum]MDD9746752.1 DctP family TRAP transporter solute-binding subunit [Marinovum sp. PR37]SEJ48848.1 tripartite ATP-independent transporter solute receptor, DctP family [Marinovum algicola]SLN34196.1 2,3-diketo-L-gulonate-binding periplasmic protein YiaO precursor [Marinovum algicola]